MPRNTLIGVSRNLATTAIALASLAAAPPAQAVPSCVAQNLRLPEMEAVAAYLEVQP